MGRSIGTQLLGRAREFDLDIRVHISELFIEHGVFEDGFIPVVICQTEYVKIKWHSLL